MGWAEARNGVTHGCGAKITTTGVLLRKADTKATGGSIRNCALKTVVFPSFVLLALVGMIGALIWDGLRPGMVLLTVVVLFLCVKFILSIDN